MPPSKPTDKRAKAPAKKRVGFETHVAHAQSVRVTGDFSQWAPEGLSLQKGAGDAWSTSLELAPGEYQYRLIVDGRWEDDPGAKKHVPNPHGSQNAVLVVE